MQCISIAHFFTFMNAAYSTITAAIPDTIAENRNTIGISGVDHHGFALIDPKMNPTYPCSRNADGMPITVTVYPTLSSMIRAPVLMLSDPSVSALYISRRSPVVVCDIRTMSTRNSSQISSSRTTVRYHRYTNPNIAIAEDVCGVRYI